MELPIEFTPYNKIVSLIKEVGEFKERRDIQSVIYILKSQGVHFGEKFTLRRNCPYSIDLQIELDDLVDGNILRENGTINFNEESPSILFSTIDQEIQNKKILIEFVSKINYQELEMICTFFYLRNFNFSIPELKLKFSRLFPDSDKDFDEIEKTATAISQQSK